MGMDQLLKSFLLSVDLDQKRDTVSLTFISWILSWFGPDNIQKPWNYHKDFKTQLQQEDRTMHLFQLKDMRFGLLSQSCAVVCYHWNDFALISLKNLTILQISLLAFVGMLWSCHTFALLQQLWRLLAFT